MPQVFIDPAVIRTPGDRGTTTRRRSTHTVRGCEGAWIAAVKEELAVRQPGWLVREERVYSPWPWESAGGPWEPVVSTVRRYDTEAEATAAAAERLTGEATRHTSSSTRRTCLVARVWVELETSRR